MGIGDIVGHALGGMGKGVQPRIGGDAGGHAHAQLRIHHGQMSIHEHAPLAARLRLADDRHPSSLRAGAGGGGDQDHGGLGVHGDGLGQDIFFDGARILHEDARRLGGVHTAAAADADDGIHLVFQGQGAGLIHNADGGVSLDAVIAGAGDTRLLQAGHGPGRDPRRLHALVEDAQGLADVSQLGYVFSQMVYGPGPEDDGTVLHILEVHDSLLILT